MFENPSSVAIATVVLGVITGLLSGALGIGGGIVVVPALVLLFGMTQKGAQGLSLAMIIPLSIIGAWQYWRYGHLQMTGSRPILLCAGAVAGALLGSMLADRLPAPILRRFFAVVMMIIAIRMLWSDSKPAAQTSRSSSSNTR